MNMIFFCSINKVITVIVVIIIIIIIIIIIVFVIIIIIVALKFIKNSLAVKNWINELRIYKCKTNNNNKINN